MTSDRGLRLAIRVSGLVAIFAAGAVCAQEKHPCATVADDAERLACYDRTFGRPGQSDAVGAVRAADPAVTSTPVAAPVPAVTVASAPAAPPADPVKDFGLTPAQQKALDPQRVEDPGPASLRATITAVQRQRDGQFVITLDNGQVWAQNDPAERAYPKAGEAVEIRKAALGSFVLESAQRRLVRVRRVK